MLQDAIAYAKQAGLVYVTDAEPGIVRRRAGKGFTYRKPRGGVVRDAKTLDRIRRLAIPPAYTDVWISAHPRGHLQATGRDARGRKQYRYHAAWSAVRNEGKFDRIVAFGEAMPKLRRRVRQDLKLTGYPREKVLALVIAVMADTMIRVGNDAYARSNRSYGLTTLRDHHVRFSASGRAQFRFRGKSGQAHEITLDDRRLVALVRGCQQLPGQTLFQYRHDKKLHPVTSSLVNAYLQDIMGSEFTTKDFRTWAGTLAAFHLCAETSLPTAKQRKAPSERALATIEKSIVGDVARLLGNTPAVCRKAYIDPVVFAAWRADRLRQAVRGARGLRQWEQATLRFLRRAHKKSG